MAKVGGFCEMITGLSYRALMSRTILVLLSLVVISLLFPLYQLDPNRVVRGEPVFFYQFFSLSASFFHLVIASFILLFFLIGATFPIFISGYGMFILWVLPIWYMNTGMVPPGYRLSPARSFWLIHVVLLIYLVLGESTKKKRALSWLGLIFLIGLVMLFQDKNPLSIIVELRAQKSRLVLELLQHLRLSLIAFLGALLFSIPLGLASVKKSWGKGFFAFAGIIQTVPSLALLGILMVPFNLLSQQFPNLRNWGISGIGMAPAVTALGLYGMLPLMTGIREGLRSIPAQTLEAGRGLGFSPWSLFWQVELPLAMPLVMAGIRTAFVQTLGNAALAPLIGAGGLGFFIFQGIGQTSTDMVLLGVFPLLILTLGADTILGGIQKILQRSHPHANALI